MKKVNYGATSEVFKDKKQAIKIIDMEIENPTDYDERFLSFCRETINVMSMGSISEYIINFLKIESTVEKTLIRMPLYDCDMFECKNNIPPSRYYTLFIRILSGLYAFHQKGFIHRDISVNNILLKKKTYEPIIIDFGYSIFFPGRICACKDNLFGTMSFSAPEILPNGYLSKYDASTDLWSLGVSILEFIIDEKLFGLTSKQIIEEYNKSVMYVLLEQFLPDYDIKESIDDYYHFTNHYADIQVKLNEHIEGKLEKFYDIPQFQDIKDLIINLIQVDPIKRKSSYSMIPDQILYKPSETITNDLFLSIPADEKRYCIKYFNYFFGDGSNSKEQKFIYTWILHSYINKFGFIMDGHFARLFLVARFLASIEYPCHSGINKIHRFYSNVIQKNTPEFMSYVFAFLEKSNYSIIDVHPRIVKEVMNCDLSFDTEWYTSLFKN